MTGSTISLERVSEREREGERRLTVFGRIEGRVGRVERREEEHSRVDRDSRSNEGDLFEVVELAREVGPSFGSENHKEENEEEDCEGLDSSAECLEED